MAYNGKDLEILKDIISRLQLPAQIILSDGRKGWIREFFEPQYDNEGRAEAGIGVNFENEDFGYRIFLSDHGAPVFAPEPELESKQ